jgi:hypothetical protein
MKYLKHIFEAKQLNGITQKLLIDNDLTQDQYMDMVDFVGKFGYGEVNGQLPFLVTMIDRDDYNIGSVDLSKLIQFYKKKKRKDEEMESTEDYFLDLIEGDKSIKVTFGKGDNTIIMTIDYSDLADLGNKLVDIDRRFKRANQEYDIESLQHSVRVDSKQKVAYLRVRI